MRKYTRKTTAPKSKLFAKKYLQLFIVFIIFLIAALILFSIAKNGKYQLAVVPEESEAATPTVRIIAADQHPNLYFNTAEIENMRKAVLVDKTPQSAVNVYTKIRSISPCNKPSNLDGLGWPDSYNAARPCTIQNMQATIAYLIEPSAAKAQAIRTALLSWTAKYGAYWSTDPQGGGHIHFALPFMYDAIYNANVLSDTEKTAIDTFFTSVADDLLHDNAYWVSFAKDPKSDVNKEGSRRQGYENWRQWEFNGGVVSALVSHNNNLGNRIYNNFPDNFYMAQGIEQYAPLSRDIKNMLGGLVYDSGYNLDGYHRVYGFNAPDASYAGQRSGQGQHYHFFATLPLIFGMEAVSHNGVDLWTYKNDAMRRTYETGYAWAGSAWSSTTSYNHLPDFWLVSRHYSSSSVINQAISNNLALQDSPYIFGNLGPLWAVAKTVTTTPPITPSPMPTNPGSNVGSVLSARSVRASSDDGNGPQNVIDGNPATRWSSYGDGEWIELDLGSVKQIYQSDIAFYNGTTRANKFEIALSPDQNNWQIVYTGSSKGDRQDLESFTFNKTEARYVRYIGHGNYKNGVLNSLWNSITEFRVVGTENGSIPTPPPVTGDTVTFNPTRIEVSAPEIVNPERGLFRKPEEVLPLTPPAMQSYSRYTWKQLEPTKDNYDFSVIDNELATMQGRKGKLTLKVRSLIARTSYGCSSNFDQTRSYPDYLQPMMEKSWCQEGMWIPDYNDSDYIDRATKLFQALGQKYNNDPRVNFIESGMYGLYGEWHMYAVNYPGPNGAQAITNATREKIIDLQMTPFPNKRFLTMTDDDYSAIYALNKSTRVGWARHSLGNSNFNSVQDNKNDLRIQKWNVMKDRWQTAPISTEFYGPGNTDLAMAIKQVADYHISLIANGNYGKNWSQLSSTEKVQFETLQKTAGYRYNLSRLTLPANLYPGAGFNVATSWSNYGNAPTYEQWDVTLQLRTSNNTVVWSGKLTDSLQAIPSGSKDFTSVLSLPNNVTPGKYTLTVQVLDPENYSYPMGLAMQGGDTNRVYTLGSVSVVASTQATIRPTSTPVPTVFPTQISTARPTVKPTTSPSVMPTTTSTPRVTPVPTASATQQSTPAPKMTTITIRAVGTIAQQQQAQFTVAVNDELIMENGQQKVYSTTGEYVDYFAYTNRQPLHDLSSVKINFINDYHSWFPYADRNLTVDYIKVNSTVYQTESSTVYSDGIWNSQTGCSAGYKQSETIACPGYVQFSVAAN